MLGSTQDISGSTQRTIQTLTAQFRVIERVKRELEKAFDSVPDLISIIDAQYIIRRVNRSMSQRTGRSPQSLIGKPCHIEICGCPSPPAYCPLTAVLADGKEQTVEVRIEKLDGFFHITATPFTDAAGKLIGCVHVARDITSL